MVTIVVRNSQTEHYDIHSVEVDDAVIHEGYANLQDLDRITVEQSNAFYVAVLIERAFLAAGIGTHKLYVGTKENE